MIDLFKLTPLADLIGAVPKRIEYVLWNFHAVCDAIHSLYLSLRTEILADLLIWAMLNDSYLKPRAIIQSSFALSTRSNIEIQPGIRSTRFEKIKATIREIVLKDPNA